MTHPSIFESSRQRVSLCSRQLTHQASRRNKRFQKLTRRERNWEGVEKKPYAKEREGGSTKNMKQREGLPSRSPPPHFSPIFCSPQACYFARLLLRSLVRSPPGKGKESAATQAKTFMKRDTPDLRSTPEVFMNA